MKKTLLIVFIHGFKGDDDTFAVFPEHVRVLVGRTLPAVKVATAVYPRYETRGDLKECVGRFQEWLQNQVIDLEVANQTASPTVDPSVHVFLMGHSMGGIVAADTLLSLASEQPIPPKNPVRNSGGGGGGAGDDDSAPVDPRATADIPPVVEPGSFMFPHIQGVLAFDTPYLGIAPGVVSYGAENHYRNATTAYSAISEVAGLFGIGGAGNESSSAGKGSGRNEANTRQAVSSQSTTTGESTTSGDAAATPSWQRWGRYAMFAGAAGAVAAGGAAAMYSQRQRLTDGWGWVSSHLAFVGCLARPAELRKRLEYLSDVHRERGIACTNFYTCLGKGATSLVESTNQGSASFSQKIIRSKHRTFCTLPPEVEAQQQQQQQQDALPIRDVGLRWIRAVNDKANDETKAHISMFLPKENPAFYELLSEACKVLVKSIDKGWYNTATGPIEEVGEQLPRTEPGRQHQTETDSGFMDGDDVVVVD